MTGLKDDACVYFPTGVCPVVPDIHFKDSQTFLDPSFTRVNRTTLVTQASLSKI